MRHKSNDEKDPGIALCNLSWLRISGHLTGLLPALILGFFLAATPVQAQGIVVNAEEALARLRVDLPSSSLFLVNGPVASFAGADGETSVSMQSFQKPLLALLTLRLVDSGVISLQSPIADLLPDVIDGGPFKAPIRIHHLLQETAGFASPPLTLEPAALERAISHTLLKRFAISVRSPGQVSSHDPVGWAVLIAALEAASATPIESLIQNQILAPLGMGSEPTTIDHVSLAGGHMPLNITMKASTLAGIAHLLLRNRDASGQAFLGYEIYQDLVRGHNGFRLHPAADITSYGLTIRQNDLHSWLEPLNTPCKASDFLMAFPVEGAVFGAFSTSNACLPPALRQTSLKLAGDLFPGRVRPAADGPPLAQPSKLEGRYVLARRSPAALSERLDILQAGHLSVFGYTGDLLRVRRNDGPVTVYRQTDAYRFDTEDDDQTRLTFSPFKLGGYVMDGDNLYRRADILAAAGRLRDMMPWALIALLTAGHYAFGSRSKPWRRMGQFAAAGSVLVGLGLYLELHSWADVLYRAGEPWLITLWRLGLNVGLMLVLSVPMFVLSFARKREIPTKGAAILTAPHLVLVAISALIIFFTLVLWGVAGTFSPY